MARSPQTLSVEERRLVAAWAADCAEHVLHIFQAASPDDPRVSAAIDQTRAFSNGKLEVGEALRRRGGAAGDAARVAPTPAAKAAAYAAEQAAGVAHMAAHALGAAGYAAKACALAGGGDKEATALAEARWQAATMTDAAADALRKLPPLGENRSGPLGPGRLSSGHVGRAIRVVQEILRDEAEAG